MTSAGRVRHLQDHRTEVHSGSGGRGRERLDRRGSRVHGLWCVQQYSNVVQIFHGTAAASSAPCVTDVKRACERPAMRCQTLVLFTFPSHQPTSHHSSRCVGHSSPYCTLPLLLNVG